MIIDEIHAIIAFMKVKVLAHHWNQARELACHSGDPYDIAKGVVEKRLKPDPRYRITTPEIEDRYIRGQAELIRLAREDMLEPMPEMDQEGNFIPRPGDFFCQEHCVARMPSQPWVEEGVDGGVVTFCPKAAYKPEIR